ncbi:MAG TPA: 6-bladed beta-propeller, partial [Longimicrobiales bacterium]|nr:6-bladed beta-propeller [Longimicrobiales bacterium]
MNRRRLCHPFQILSILALSAVVGCGGGTGATGFAARDSAGIRVVENGTPATGVRAWHVSSDPEVDIGVLEGAPEYQLFRVFSAVRLSNGHIVVANSGTRELRFYDTAGRYLRSAGRQGDGPGEFRSLGRILRLAGDTLVVYDSNLRRLTWFSEDGALLRSAAVGGGDAGTIPIVSGAFGDGSMLASAAVVFRPGANPHGVSRDSTRYFRLAADGTLSDTLGSFLTAERYVGGDEQVFYVTSLPFGLTPASATADDGFYYGTGRDPEVGAYDAAGRLTRLVRWGEPGRPVTKHDVDAEKAHQLAEA